ncbi:MAG: undecaprenyldiphospho-muramoylpentapeptide beta-N-acetylglucosaminyltransferase [bacterium]|nr:undecaprenyldiphospho-muramoylpentapeptide beta-N-acetylglucosaminyltransferase [bacterium]
MKVIISAGGTGGHVFPALAIINKIKEEEPDSEILYIGTTDRMESTLIPSLGIKYVGIEMKGLNRKNLLKNYEVFLCLSKGIKQAKKIIKKFNPDIVLGIGGYITYPVITAASSLGYKTFIHEQNSIPGLSNKILKNKVNKVGVSLESSMKYFNKNNTIFTGNPRSEEAIKALPVSKKKYNLKDTKKLVLIVMGSLGSMTINNIMKDILPKFKNKKYEVLFVTGKNYYEKYKKIDNLPENVKIVEFLNDMLGVMKNTDLIVSRAGASTIAEITALNLPSILIPSPYVTHNHQYENAKVLSDAGASILIEEKDLNAEILLKNIDNVLNNKEKYVKMKSENDKLAIKNSSTKIYEIIKDIINGD